jgi:hypothetical protein
MSATPTDNPESGELPSRIEFIREPSEFEVPTDPDWNRASDVMRSFSASPGASMSRQDSIGTPDAVDHNRGTEDPSLDVSYDLQQFFVDSQGDPLDPSGDGIIRDSENQLPNTQLWVERRENSGGNDDAGVRIYTVARGCKVDTVSPTLDPSAENPILMELTLQPRKVRSYLIHQPSTGTTLDIVSSDDSDTMDITIESEDGTTTETITLTGTTTVTSTTTFSDIDAVWLDEKPIGDISITDGNGTVLVESTSNDATNGAIAGGLSYSDDDQPVDGDRGVPTLGSGSHASAIGTDYEHFVGDRWERPDGSRPRARINSAGWTVENNIETSSIQTSRLPVVDEGNRNVTTNGDIAGPFASHNSMMESLQKTQQDQVHELSGGTVTLKNAVPTDSAERTVEADQAVASFSETLSCSGDPAIVVSAN